MSDVTPMFIGKIILSYFAIAYAFAVLFGYANSSRRGCYGLWQDMDGNEIALFSLLWPLTLCIICIDIVFDTMEWMFNTCPKLAHRIKRVLSAASVPFRPVLLGNLLWRLVHTTGKCVEEP